MQATGWSFPVSAVTVSLILGAIAMILMYRIAEPHVGWIGAAGLVAIACCFASAPLLQVAYSESLALCLVLWSLTHLSKQQYWWALVPLLLLSFTRLITPPLGFVVIFHVWIRVRYRREKINGRESVALFVYVVCSLVGVAVWSWVASSLGGGVGASRAGSMVSNYSGGWFGAAYAHSTLGGISLGVLALTFLVGVLRQWRSWGPELSAWAAGYPLFILLVTPPTTGLVRYLLLAFPLGLAFVGSDGQVPWRRTVRVGLVCGVFFGIQVLWVRYSFVAPAAGLGLMP